MKKQETVEIKTQYGAKHHIKLPGIGMRIVKSALAVALCMVINLLRGDDGIVFYSQLAALWCIQMYRNNTLKNALQRVIGTCVGAVCGLIYLLVFSKLRDTSGSEYFMEILCVFVGIIIVLYATVLINKKQASYFSCVVFLSIIINHIEDINPYFFVWNRFLDTIIGVCIGIFINNIRICPRPDRETLFVSGVDEILLDEHEHISAFSKVELNRMIDNGMKFTISTMRTPASLITPLADIKLKYPAIVMDGAALYDVKTNEYIKTYVISPETSNAIIEKTKSTGLCTYTNVIIDDTLLIYYRETEDEVNRKLVDKLKTSPFRNYINREYPGDENVIYFMLLDETEKIDSFYENLIREGFGQKLKILHYKSDDFNGYSYIKIYNRNASKENMLAYLKEKYNINNTVTLGTIDGKYDICIQENNLNEMVKSVRKMYEPILGIKMKNNH